MLSLKINKHYLLAIIAATLFLSLAFFYGANLNAGDKSSSHTAKMTCRYNPDSGKPNPLGLRTFITVIEENGSTHFVYEKFPQPLAAHIPLSLSSTRTLIMHGLGIDDARSTMRENPAYYTELIGETDNIGFSIYDEVMVCREETYKNNS